jgi:hypothetical protein
MSGVVSSLPQFACMAWCLVKHRDNFCSDQFRNSSMYMKWSTDVFQVPYLRFSFLIDFDVYFLSQAVFFAVVKHQFN